MTAFLICECPEAVELVTGNVHKISIFKPSEFQSEFLPPAFRVPVQKPPPPPLALGIPKSRPSWCMDIFWKCPLREK